MTLADAVVVVTGGSRGIGRACVLHAVEAGAHVAFCSRQNGPESRAVEAEAAARSGQGRAVGMAADVSVEADVIRLFAIVRERFGRIDAVVSNAAVSRERLLVSTGTEDWDAVVAANLTGSFLVARQALRTFLEQGRGGRIVAVGTLAQHGAAGNASYAAAKGGVLGLTRMVARQYAELGIRMNMVVPGYVETALSADLSASAKRALIDQCPQRRAGSPDEIAAVVTFLLSDDAAGVHGQAVFASGGLLDVPV